MAEEEKKVYVAVPAEPREGQSALSWALGHLSDDGAATIIVTHVHVPPQTIPVMGVKFHVSKMGGERVRQFRKVERQKADEMLDDYVRRCSEIKVKCEKLVIENEDVVSGLIELIRLHGITRLVVAVAADRHYSKKLVKPVSKTATEITRRADPSCKIWFVCKGQLIYIRDKAVQIAQSASHQQEDDIQTKMVLYSELQKAKAYEDMYLEEVRKREELEAVLLEEVMKRQELKSALTRADEEIARLWRTFQRPTEEPQMRFHLGEIAGQPAEPW